MRFILLNGTVLVGTQVGGDAEWVMIQTSTGVVQVRRAEISSMDYNVGQVAQPGVMVVAPQPQQPLYMGPPPRRRGRGLLIAGSIVFGISYGLSALIGITAAGESPSALWFVVPVAGPILWANTTCDGGEFESGCRALATTFGAFITIVQAAGMVMLIVGATMRAGDEPQPVAEGEEGLRLGLAPLLGPDFQGLGLRTAF
jgi:hypothetical protein